MRRGKEEEEEETTKNEKRGVGEVIQEGKRNRRQLSQKRRISPTVCNTPMCA
jgi:hypothetical protein